MKTASFVTAVCRWIDWCVKVQSVTCFGPGGRFQQVYRMFELITREDRDSEPLKNDDHSYKQKNN